MGFENIRSKLIFLRFRKKYLGKGTSHSDSKTTDKLLLLVTGVNLCREIRNQVVVTILYVSLMKGLSI